MDKKVLKKDDKVLKKRQGIFYGGKVHDADVFMADLIQDATKSIVLVDSHFDDSVLTLFSKRKSHTTCTIYTKNITEQSQLDIDTHNAQYPKIEINNFNNTDDKFLIFDDKEVYRIGASLKDLGKKWFTFSKLYIDSSAILSKLDNVDTL
jgi:hypothetical protein